MSDIEGTISLKQTGIEEIDSALKKLGITLTKIIDQTENLVDSFDSLKNIDFQNISHLRYGKTSLAYSRRSARDNEKADRIIDAGIKAEEKRIALLEEKNRILEKDNEQLRKIQQERNSIRAKNASTAVSEAARKQKESDELRKFRAYKNEHPDQFTNSKRNSGKYKAGTIIANATSQFSDQGLAGKALSSSGEVVGAGLMAGWAGAIAVGVTKIGAGIKDFTSSVTDAYANLEALKTQLSVVFGNETMSVSIFSETAQYATKSPYGVQQTTEIVTLLRQSGVEASRVMDTLKMLGDTAGGNMEKMKRIANNYAQIVSIGKASMLDMRQFAYAGIPIFEAVSNELGVSQSKLRKLISDGKVTAEIVEKVFKNMTGINGIFENATEKGAKTLKGRLQNLEDIKTLAKGTVGERYNRSGETYGGDSSKMRRIEMSEKFYDRINNLATFKNLETSVKSIEKRDSRAHEIDRILNQLKENPKENKALIEYLEAERQKLMSQWSRDDIRSNRAALWETKNNINKNGTITIDLSKYEKDLPDSNVNISDEIGYFDPESKLYTVDLGLLDKESLKVLQHFFKGIKVSEVLDNISYGLLTGGLYTLGDYFKGGFETLGINEFLTQVELAQKALDISPENKIWWQQRENIMTAQQVVDENSYLSKKSDSAANLISQLRNEWEELPEQKQKERDEELKKYEEIISQLKDINANTKDGILDFDKVSSDQLKEWSEKGYLTARVLDVGGDTERSASDLKLWAQQFQTRYNQIIDKWKGGNFDLGVDDSGKKMYQDLYFGTIKTDSKFGRIIHELNEGKVPLNMMNSLYQEMLQEIEDNIANSSGEFKERWEEILEAFRQASVEWKSTSENLDYIELSKFKNDDFIPLWKRILGNGLGISPLAITDTRGALDFYQNDTAVRQTAGSIFTAALKNGMSIDTLQSIISETKGLRKIKDGGDVWQVDWETVRKNLKNLSMSVSASTAVIDAYKSAKEKEYDTLVELVGSGIWAQESNGKHAKYISADQLDKEWLSDDDIGVNAFGERLENAEGEIVAELRDGIAYNKDGVALANQQLVITGKIFEEMKKRLPKIKQDLISADNVSAKNHVINQAVNNHKQEFLKHFIYGDTSIDSTLIHFGENYWDTVDSLIKNKVENYLNENTDSKYASYEDFLEKAMTNEKDVEIFELEIIRPVMEELRKLIYGNDILTYDTEELYKRNKQNIKIADIQTGESEKERTAWRTNGYFERKVMEQAGLDSTLPISDVYTQYGDDLKAAQALAKEGLENVKETALQNLEDITMKTLWDGFVSPFQIMGEDLLYLVDKTKTWTDVWKDLGGSMQSIAGELVEQTGTLATNAGLALVQSGALTQNWGMIAGGLALAAAGGFAAAFGQSIANYNKDNTKTDEAEKLKSITDQIKDILEQARSDAAYYENNLRHRTALGINEKFSYTSVNDAVITPRGEVVKTDPKDYLIATKTPQAIGGSTVVQPQISFNVIDNVGVKVKTEQKIKADGTIELKAVLMNAMDEYISTERSDEAFSVRKKRMEGIHSIM